MLLRYRADLRTLLWATAMPVVALTPYFQPQWSLRLTVVSCYLALAAGVIAHNHNHCPTFKNRKLNTVFGYWLSIFYGYPVFAWVPTHNLNHHKYENKAGDATITWRHTNRHNWLVASTYFYVSSYYQSDPIKAYIRNAKAGNKTLYRSIIRQYVIWAGAHVALFSIACLHFGFWQGARIWVFAFGLPAFFALWTIMLFNYIQHVHTDPWSDHNHSRSFQGKLINFLLFNNGLHAAHHEKAGAHWSTLPALHAHLSPNIAPELQPYGFFAWCFRSYVLAPFLPSFGTRQVGRAPFDDPTSKRVDVTSADVEALEPGINALRV